MASSHSGLVTYGCGACGYALNLRSSDRNTAGIGSEYRKAIRKGIVSFSAVDDSRFGHSDELIFSPHFQSKRSWGLLQRRTRLVCRKCGGFVGYGYEEGGAGTPGRYEIRIGALQPVSEEDAGGLSTGMSDFGGRSTDKK